MKILLIHPYCLEERINTEDVTIVPIGVYYVGAVLKEEGYDVEILNWHGINKTPHLIKETLNKKKPDVIGVSILHANRWGGIEIARIAKQVNPNIKVAFGGVGATFLWKHLLTHFIEIDYTVIGEGEHTFLNLIKFLEGKGFKSIENVKGIAFREKGKVVTTPKNEPIADLDVLPNPAKYFTYQHVALTRGCPAKCTFCGSPKIWGKKVRAHSATCFVNQLEALYKKGVTFFYFSDDTFTYKKALVVEICKNILERGLNITWAAISRVNSINQELLHWMRKAGCVQISYGVESGSEKIRDQLNKNIKTDQIRKAFALTSSYGIMARAYFIYGSPGENRETIQETLDLIHEIKPLSAIFYILDIFPGTRLYDDFQKRTGATDDIWLEKIEDIMYFETDSRLSQEEILAFGKTLRTGFYKSLSGFADRIKLVDKKEFFELHADFLSKLAMTFSHGDYAGIKDIKGKQQIAKNLYKRSLDYFPNHRAYLGLGMLAQKKRAFEESIEILSKGLEHFPEHEQLGLCLGLSYMNLKKFEKALSCFLKLKGSKEADYYISRCYQAG